MKKSFRVLFYILVAASAFALSLWVASWWKAPTTSMAPVTYSAGDLRLQLAGIESPTVTIKMAANAPTVIEIPGNDDFYVIHPGNTNLVTLDENIRPTDHFIVLRTGSDFPQPPSPAAQKEIQRIGDEQLEEIRQKNDEQWENLRRAAQEAREQNGLAPQPKTPITIVTVQMRSGATVAFRIEPVESVDEATKRCIITYDRAAIVNARQAAGLAVNLK